MLGFVWNPITKRKCTAWYIDPTFHFIQWIGLVGNHQRANATGASDVSVTSITDSTVLEVAKMKIFFVKELPSVHYRKTAHSKSEGRLS
jgi:hypothetical protein